MTAEAKSTIPGHASDGILFTNARMPPVYTNMRELKMKDVRATCRFMLIDSHCHLNYPGLVEDEEGVIARARAAGVTAMISISTRENEWDDVIAGAERHADVYATVGIHPHEADLHSAVDTAKLVSRAKHSKVIGIGETGLDYFYDKSDRNQQRISFFSHINASQETQLPLIVHTRDAEDDTIEMLTSEMRAGEFPMVIHCFTGSRRLAEACLDLGAYISLSGIVTFKNARALQETAQFIPADRLLIETDSPFLAPVPMRGKVCEPAYVAHTAKFLAQLRNTNIETFLQDISNNTLNLFKRMKK